MLGIEEFRRSNSDKIGFLSHLLAIGATSELLLAQTSQLLEAESGPFVAALCQLPFVLDGGDSVFQVPGWRDGVTVQLRLTPATAAFSVDGKLTLLGPNEEASTNAIGRVQFTQVVALIRLWSKRGRLHRAYLNHLTPTGVRRERLGNVENWMELPEASFPLPARRHAPLTTEAFEGEIARRIRAELQRALAAFLSAYSLAHLENVRWDEKIYGYFTMTSPTRIANGGAPLPIAVGLAKRATDRYMVSPTQQEIAKLLGKVHVASTDRILRQLIAMNELLQRGEPELAAIGCTSTVEFFLNSTFPELTTEKNGRSQSSSLFVCSKHPALAFLSQEWKQWLQALAYARNPLVHGAVPDGRDREEREPAISAEFVRSALKKALELYRLINIYTGRTYAPLPSPPAPLND